MRFKAKHIDYDVTHSNGLESFIMFFKKRNDTIFQLEFNLKENADRTPLESNNILVSLHDKTMSYSYIPQIDNVERLTEAVDLDFNLVDYFINDFVANRR